VKFGELKSIAHNISDSLASGIGLLVGVYDTDVFAEAARSAEGYIDVDFLTGRVSGGAASASLSMAIGLYAGALPALCAKHGTLPTAFRQLRTRYQAPSTFIVTVEDQDGRMSADTYEGRPGRRVLAVDAEGRIRPMPGVRKDSHDE